jgi:hypothetical protein
VMWTFPLWVGPVADGRLDGYIVLSVSNSARSHLFYLYRNGAFVHLRARCWVSREVVGSNRCAPIKRSECRHDITGVGIPAASDVSARNSTSLLTLRHLILIHDIRFEGIWYSSVRDVRSQYISCMTVLLGRTCQGVFHLRLYSRPSHISGRTPNLALSQVRTSRWPVD